MLGLLRWPAIALLAFTVSACATTSVSSHVAHDVTFGQYHTWQWATADFLPETSGQVDTPQFRDSFQGAAEREFATRGFTQTWPEAPADLLVHYHANLSPRMEILPEPTDSGACYDADCNIRVVDDDTDTLVLDVVDAQTGHLIWRGWAQHVTAGTRGRPDLFRSRIREAVERMFREFPKAD